MGIARWAVLTVAGSGGSFILAWRGGIWAGAAVLAACAVLAAVVLLRR